MRALTLIRTLAILLLLCAAFFLFLVFGPHKAARIRDIPIQRGASLTEIGRVLQDSGAVYNGLAFAAAAKLSGKSRRLQSGTYRFPYDVSTAEIIDALASGKHQVEVWITFNEGITVRGIASRLQKRLGMDSASFVRAAREPRLLRSLGIAAEGMEGYLYPDTYLFRLEVSPESVITRMHRRLLKALEPELRDRMKRRNRSLHEIMTMASIIEGETKKPEERARIAGVYYNRLHRGMKLQADPTIQYLIPDGPRRLLYRDLKRESPYNTYLRRGLPPGPVNNPGIAAVTAALYPESHKFLYFVADGSGGHKFSRNAQEHAAAVSEYRRIMRESTEQ